MMNKWFSEIFLSSLFQRGKSFMLTAKQVNVCAKYMEAHSGSYYSAAGNRYSANWYSCKWQGREVSVSSPYPNGCAMITFGFTKEESEMEARKEEERKAWEHENIIKRIKANSERLQKKLDRYNSQLDKLEKLLQEEMADGEAEKEDIEYYTEKIEEIKKHIEELTA